MYRIIDGRGTGKTSRLMLLAKENNGVIVCANPQKMREKAEVYGIIGLEFISYKEFQDIILLILFLLYLPSILPLLFQQDLLIHDSIQTIADYIMQLFLS